MKKDKELITNQQKYRGPIRETVKVQSLQDKIGASAEQIRRAIEAVGFDRDKVEQYLVTSAKRQAK